MAGWCRLGEENPGFQFGLELGENWTEGRDKVCIDETPGGFGLWAEQLLAESTGKEGKGLVPAPGESAEGGSDRQHGACGSTIRTTSAPSSSAGSSRRPSPARSSASIRSTSRTCRRPRTRPHFSHKGQALSPGPEGSLDELLAEAEPPQYIAIQAFIDPEREGDLDPLVTRARETGCVVTKGLGPRYLHSTGQLHKGGPNTVLAIQVVDDFGEELAIPGKEFGFRQLIAAQAAGDSRIVEGARAEGLSCETGGSMKLGMVGLGRMGSGMTERLRGDGHEVMTYDPQVESTARRSRSWRSSWRRRGSSG